MASRTTGKQRGHTKATRKSGTTIRKVRRGADVALSIGKVRFEAVMKAAEHSGLLGEKSKRIGGRISPALVEQAKRHTGIEGDTDLIEFALASVALDDDFGRTFRQTRGTVDPDLKLGF